MIRDLRRCGLLREEDQILSRKAMFLRYANVIFDLDRASALKTVHGYLDDLKSHTAGAMETGATCGPTKASLAESGQRSAPFLGQRFASSAYVRQLRQSIA